MNPMTKWVLAGVAFFLGTVMWDYSTQVALILMAPLVLMAGLKLLGKPKQQTLPALTEHRDARHTARGIARDADREAEALVASAVRKAEKKGRAAIKKARAQIAAENEQRWVS